MPNVVWVMDEAVCIGRNIFVITVQSYFRDLTNIGSLVTNMEESNHILWNNERLHYVRSVNKCENRTWNVLRLGTHQVVPVETSYFDIQQFSKNTSTVIVPWMCQLDIQNGLAWVCTTERTHRRDVWDNQHLYGLHLVQFPSSKTQKKEAVNWKEISWCKDYSSKIPALCHIYLHLKWRKLQISNQGFHLLLKKNRRKTQFPSLP